MAEMTPEQAGKMLRQLAERTFVNSKNWDNYEAICVQFITDAYKGGKAAALTSAEGTKAP